MKRKKMFLFSLLLVSSLSTEEQPADIDRVSEAFGHIIGKNLKNIDVQFDVAKVVKGMQDSLAGKQPPMSEMECVHAIDSVQEKNFTERSKENQKLAEAFLANNTKIEGIITLEKGMVQYCVVEQGSGAVVKPHSSPLIRYTVKALDGSILGTASAEESVSLNETIPGLKAGLLGMKEGEKRIIYIHPDFAYGTKESFLPPNLLLTFEVEILKADAPLDSH